MTVPEVPSLIAWVRPDRVRAEVEAVDAEGVLRELARLLAGSGSGIRFEEVLALLREREQLGSTGVGDGCAIPHARLAKLDTALLAVARSTPGIEFGSPDGGPVRLFFGLAAPADASGTHLRVLSAVARWLRDPSRREALLTAPDASAMFALLASS